PPQRRFAPLARPLPLVAAMAWLCAPHALRTRSDARDLTTTLVTELASEPRNLETSEADVHWLARPHGVLESRLFPARAVVRAHRRGEHWDIYVVDARMSPEGALLGIDRTDNLTRTKLADESLLDAQGNRAAWAIGDASRY